MNRLLPTCLAVAMMYNTPSTGSDEKRARISHVNPQQQLYESLTFTNQENFLKRIAQEPQLRGQRVATCSSMIELCMMNHRIPYQQALQLGIPIDQQDSSGRTCLMQVARGYWEEDSVYTPVTQELLALNADPTIQDDAGRNALGYALSSDHAARQALVLASHPKIAAIINEPTLIHGHKQTYLGAIINSSPAYDFYRKKIAKVILNAGAHIALENVEDAANLITCCKPLFKRCSLDLLQQALPAVENYTRCGYPLLSRKRALCRGIAYQSREGELKKLFPRPIYKLVKGYFETRIDW